MRIMVLGADGYIGWPLVKHLLLRGHRVCAVDNHSKRWLATVLNVKPLVNHPVLPTRVKGLNDETLSCHVLDLAANQRRFDQIVQSFQPDAVVHLAEQPSGPYSMIGQEQADYTLRNNLYGTFNLIWSVLNHKPDCHIVKLGTAGEYGTPPVPIPEGWLTLTNEKTGESQQRLFPRQAGSFYHTMKILETDLLHFYSRFYGLTVTDIMQGPVYGLSGDPDSNEIETHLWYDHVFGTVLNRFLVQAVAGYPLTVYGAGGQTRGYINLADSIEALRLVCENPPATGSFRVINQFVETFTVNQLAIMVQAAASLIRLDVQIQNIPNPRREAERHFYEVKANVLKQLGLRGRHLTVDRLIQMLEIVQRYKGQIDQDQIMPTVYWQGKEPK